MANYQILIIFAIILSGFDCNQHDEDEVFVPTKQWQIVKKGQKIPQGLHVRMDLSTGVTEAKLLDDNEKNRNSIIHVPQSNDEPIETKQIPKSVLRDQIEKLQNDDRLNAVEDKFRNYDELKQTLDELNLTPRLDSEIITELLIKHDELSTINHRDEILKILEDLDYLTHQYDNAIVFVDNDGFNRIIYKNLNSTIIEIRSKTLQLLSTITQNNNKPKIYALETGTITVLLRLIHTDPDIGIKLRGLTALSCLLRSFPVAQRKFIENGGFTTLIKYFDTDNIKIQIKIITIISDLIIEHRFANNDVKLKPYYYNFDLMKFILEQNWCENLNKLLYRLIIVDNQDHDSIEKCLIAMHSLKQQCRNKFDKKLLITLQLQYQILIDVDKDEDSDFFNSLKQVCDEILLYVNDSITVKTEL